MWWLDRKNGKGSCFPSRRNSEARRAGATCLTGLCDRAGLSAGCLRRPRRPAAFLARLGGAAHSEAWHGTQAASFLAAVGAGPRPGYRRGEGHGERGLGGGRRRAGGGAEGDLSGLAGSRMRETPAKGHFKSWGPGASTLAGSFGEAEAGVETEEGGRMKRGEGGGEAGSFGRACGPGRGGHRGASWRSGGSRAHFWKWMGWPREGSGNAPKGAGAPVQGLPGA